MSNAFRELPRIYKAPIDPDKFDVTAVEGCASVHKVCESEWKAMLASEVNIDGAAETRLQTTPKSHVDFIHAREQESKAWLVAYGESINNHGWVSAELAFGPPPTINFANLLNSNV